jgi:hypothetical protein
MSGGMMAAKDDETGTAAREPGDLRARTFAPPPEGFDPLRATDRQLLAHGLPPRPEEPDLLRQWTRALGRIRTTVVPAFRPLEHRQPPRPALQPSAFTSGNWSGAVVQASAEEVSIVGGVWNVPNPYPQGETNLWYYSSSWIGIDTWGDSPSRLQVGMAHDAIRNPDGIDHYVAAWWAWNSGMWTFDFPVAPGDLTNWLICVDKRTFASATIYLLNESSGASTSFQVQPADGTALSGTSAQWIVEAPLYQDTAPEPLANYGAIYFDGAQSSAGNAGNGDTITMVDSQGNLLSRAARYGDRLVQCTFVAP